ncbi:unnamed protein product, partial [Polarella glacialis]
ERGRALASAVRFAKSAALGFKSVRAPAGNYVATELHEESQLPSTTSFVHASVLLDEVVEAFVAAELGPGSLVVDCTLGGGGHSEALLQQLPQIRLLGIDRDPLALEAAGRRLARFGARVELAHGNFADIRKLLLQSSLLHASMQPGRSKSKTASCSGILADLGVSSPQLDLPERGFSFRAQGPLDMRMDPSDPDVKPAAWYLENLSASQLAGHIQELGGEDSAFAKAVAEKLTLLRPRTTLEAAKIVEEQAGLLRAPVQDPSGRQSVHPATKTFQALRILVNGELESASQPPDCN